MYIQQRMTECNSEFTQGHDLMALLENTMLRVLKSTDKIIQPSLGNKIKQKIQEIADHDQLVQTLEFFLYSLIDQIQLMKISITKRSGGESERYRVQDYQNLEAAVQKAEGQIRKHIRLQQQLKIYMDGLEEQIEDLQKQLKAESEKYKQLFQNARIVEQEKKELHKKIKAYQHKYKPHQDRQIKHLSHKASKLLTEPSTNDFSTYKNAYERHRVSRAKNLLQKSTQNTKNIKILGRSKSKGIDNPINVSLGASPRNIKKRQKTTEPQQLNQTFLLKDSYKKNSRKILKYHTENQRSALIKKQLRSSSVCN